MTNVAIGVGRPELSIVLVIYNMAREAPRTLYSLSALYQRDIAAGDYEVIVVDNGSRPPFDHKLLDGLAGNFRLISMDPAHPSPVQAANRGLAEARGDIIGMMIDGARIATPGLLHFARHGAALYPRAGVTALAWHLGFDMQNWAVEAGYDAAREDALLASIDWQSDGYRLFEISTFAGSSTDGWFLTPAESSALFLRRDSWEMLGGLDERFDLPGGGFANPDLWQRVLQLPGLKPVILLGEGTFHQLHGGIATNAAPKALTKSLEQWTKQYQAIRGHAISGARFPSAPTYLGTLSRPALTRFVRGALDPARVRLGDGDTPLGADFDRSLWSGIPIARPGDPTAAALVDLAHGEFRAGRFEAAAAVSRVTRRRYPDEPEPQRLLAQVGPCLPHGHPPADRRAEVHAALAEALRLCGEVEQATTEYRAARAVDSDWVQAHWPSLVAGLKAHDIRASERGVSESST